MNETFPIINSYPPVCSGGPAPVTCGSSDPLQTYYFFGANGAFIPQNGLPTYPNGVIAFDKLNKKTTFVGYIVGGIASTITDTNCDSDSQSSSYVFKVTVHPR